jgi:deferrochelatase/peroxidase EfeB
MAALDKDDIQGNILHGHRLPWVVHLFCSMSDDRVEKWKELIGMLCTEVTRASERAILDANKTTLNIGLSYAGLAKLYPRPLLALSLRFEAFVQGMAHRSRALGDPREPDIDWAAWSARDLWISLYGPDEKALVSRLERLRNLVPELELGGNELWGRAIERGGHRFEHFGFRDGIVSPAVDGAHDDPKRVIGNGKIDEHGNWAPIAAGEFILGYPNERGELVLADLPDDLRMLLENGTFAVFRDLEQHVSEFHGYIARKSRENPGCDLAAKMIGRKPDGESLAVPGQDIDFTYEDDPGGARCPVGAHVRRANPREKGLGLHRLIRRGMPYPARPEFSDKRGLYFVAMNASIENQFEFLQKAWINGPRGGLSASRDPVAASGGGLRKMLIEGSGTEPPILLLDIPEFVSCRGGQYYFMPGCRALALLAAAAGNPESASMPAQSGGLSHEL